MKLSTYLCGLISSVLLIIAIIMKSLHWPGSGVTFTVAIAIFAFGYAVLLYLDKNKFAQNNFQKLVNAMTLVAMVVVSVSFLFKAMHWPGAGILIYISHFTLIVMVPMLFLQGSKESDPVKKLNLNNTAILFTLVTAVSIYLWWRTSIMTP